MTREHEAADGRRRSTNGGQSGTAPEERSRPATDRTAPSRTTRRAFVAALGAGVAAPTLGASTGSAASGFTDFVETDGAQFVVDGQPVYFNGSNNFWITDGSGGSRDRIDRVFSLFEEMGIDLVRMWANGVGDGLLQPAPGEHDEEQLRLHDYAVAAARDHGIRLILSLVDNWEHEGGMLQYAEWTGGEGRAHFYRDEDARDLYRNHVETMVTRTNTVTGVEYCDDPTIAMWELANEPRLEADDAGLDADADTVRAEGIHKEILGNWIQDTSAYVKELDSNHLVSTGSEGHFYGEPDAGYPDDDWDGQAFLEHHAYDTVDAASFHWYPDHWFGHDGGEIPLDRGSEWIHRHVQAAHEELGKPAYLGEFNVNGDDHSLATRNEHLEDYYAAADEADADGMAIWQVVLPETEDHDGFQVYDSESGHVIREYADVVRSKSGGANGEPMADAVVPDALRVGETGSFTGAYSRGATGDITEYEWTLDGGAAESGERITRSFEDAGDVPVELTVTDESGAKATDSEVVTIEALPEDSFLVEGAGEQVHDDVAQFHFASTTVSGDFAVEAKVGSMTSTSSVAQAGILASNDPDDARAIGGVAITPSNGSEQVRSYDDGSPVWLERADDGRSPPLWLRLERTADTIASYVSEDGESWTQLDVGGNQVNFDEEVHLGLFVSSNAPGDLCAAQFDEVSWLGDWSSRDVGAVERAGNATAGSGDGGPSVPDAPATVSVVDASTAVIELEWSSVSDVDGYTLYLEDDPIETVAAGETTGTLSGLDLLPDERYTVGVAARNDAGESARTETSVSPSSQSPCEAVGATDGAEVDGQTVCDVDGDGHYRDVNGDGAVSNGDVTDFFSNQHAPAWDERTELFDFDEDGDVGQGDVVDLFHAVN